MNKKHKVLGPLFPAVVCVCAMRLIPLSVTCEGKKFVSPTLLALKFIAANRVGWT